MLLQITSFIYNSNLRIIQSLKHKSYTLFGNTYYRAAHSEYPDIIRVNFGPDSYESMSYIFTLIKGNCQVNEKEIVNACQV